MIMGVNLNIGIIFLVALLISSESRFVNKKAKERRSDTCNANNKTYNLGETIVYATDSVDDARCKTCECFAGGIIYCVVHSCLLIARLSLCDNWITKEGECCPICETCTAKNAKPWIKRLSSDDCHECSCNGEIIRCQRVWCAPCLGVPVNTPGKCCPQCTPYTSCNANNKTYNLGETIVYHTVTDPVHEAMCKMCECSAWGITGCTHNICFLGLGVTSLLCDNWIIKEGKCCPICETCTAKNVKPWIKRFAGRCYECSCNGEIIHCQQTWCVPCLGVTVTIPGKCCPQCTPNTTCNANNKTYNLGETIVYHTVTDPVDYAMCKMCKCSAWGITGCAHYFCDLGVRPSLCNNWITKEGICCPICETCTAKNVKPWIKRLSSHDCYECSCYGESIGCQYVWCAPCPGVTVNIPGKCCPQCTPTTQPPDSFTIQLSTTQPPPNFPNFPGFPSGKRGVISADEKPDDKENDKKEE